jgi:hypothetical protein
VLIDKRRNLIPGHRLGDQISLHFIAFQLSQARERCFVFDARFSICTVRPGIIAPCRERLYRTSTSQTAAALNLATKAYSQSGTRAVIRFFNGCLARVHFPGNANS